MRYLITLSLTMLLSLPGFRLAFGAPVTTITANGLGTNVSRSGNILNITGGTPAGGNLFHSFSTFNLGTGNTVDFIVSNTVTNILARVTGGPSTIDGTITSTVGNGGQVSHANLYFINPSGVMFTANAQINLGGSFVVSTANYVRLSDGSMFQCDVSDTLQDGGLTSSPVSAFGFVGPSPAGVDFIGAELTVLPGKGLHVIAGDISLDQGSPDGITQRGASLAAPTGQLTLFSGASAGVLVFDLSAPGNGHAQAPFTAFGKISVQHRSSVAIDGAGGGHLVIRGGKLTVDNSSISSLNDGAMKGGNIDITTGELNISNGGFIGTDSELGATAGAGSVRVATTGNATISGATTTGIGSQISADTETDYAAGDITLQVGGRLSLQNGGSILANTDGGGHGGSVNVHAASLEMGHQSGIGTVSAAGGDAGDIMVTVDGRMRMDGGKTASDQALIAADTYAGQGGNVTVQASRLDMTGRSLISSNTLGLGKGGIVSVKASELSIKGTGFLRSAFHLYRVGLTGITAESLGGTGDAGSVSVNAGLLNLAAGGVISAASYGAGLGGPVTVRCGQGQLANQSEISATSFTDAGNVSITATESFTISGNSTVTTSAGQNGGDITLIVGKLLYLLDSDIQGYAGIGFRAGSGVGTHGGNILIDPDFVVLKDGLISANDLAPGGKDGNIENLSTFLFVSESLLHATGIIQSPAPDLDLGDKLVGLTNELVHAENRLRESCAASINHEFSSFIVVGRNGTETAPDELQPDFGL